MMCKPVSAYVTAMLLLALTAPSLQTQAQDLDQAQPKAAGPPNIIFIFTDDHASAAISAYGSVINETPNIDRIAQEGVLFENCLVTNSICGPSRATILTGKYSHENGFYTNKDTFDGEQPTFIKMLKNAGYQTAIVGKWHLKSDPVGFDYWNVLIGQGTYYNPRMIDNGTEVKLEGYTTDLITDLSLDWLKNQRDADKPFVLMFQHKAPHRAWEPSPKHLTMYDDVTIPEPDTLFDDYEGRGTAAHTQKMMIAKDLSDNDLKLSPRRGFTEEQLAAWNAAYEPKNEAFRQANLQGDDLVHWKYQRYIKDYLRCVASVDDSIGRVLDYLEESGLAENTIVVYSSDQGWYLGEHGWYDKRWMYEESLSTPLLVRWPGVTKPGTVNHDMVSNVDFAETFLDAAGLKLPDDMHGDSLVPILKGETPDDWRDSFYYHYYEYPGWHMVRRHYGVRTETHKLMYFYNLDEWEMYDLKADPNEMNSVYDDPAYADVRAELQAELKRLRKELNVGEDTIVLPDREVYNTR
jgi:arylsulfatase A-like enzyme